MQRQTMANHKMKWSDGSEGPVSESFRKRATPAAFGEAWVGALLARAGLWTLHEPFEVDGDKSHGLTYDLTVFKDPDHYYAYGLGITVEVKSRSLQFTNASDYPHEKVFCCSTNN